MKRGSRNALVAFAGSTLVAGLLVTVTVSAGAQSEATTGPVDCGVKVYRLLFWPDGHEAVPSIGFPEYLVPHLEVYKGKGNTYEDSDAVGYAEAATATVRADCEPADPVTAPKEPKNSTTTSEGATFTCKTKKHPVLSTNPVIAAGANPADPSTGPVGSAFTLTLGRRLVIGIAITQPGSDPETQVVYDSKLCKKSELQS